MLPIFTSLAFAADERSMLEDAVWLRLAPMYKAYGGPLEELGFYNGELDTEEGWKELGQRLVGACPAVLIAGGGSRYDPTDLRRRRYKEFLSLDVLVASAHLRDRETRNRRDTAAVYDRTADPGCYALLRAVKDLLIGWNLQVDGMGELQPLQEDAVIQTPDVTLWRMLFRVPFAEIRPNPNKAFATSVPVSVIRIRHHAVDGDGDGVGYRDVVITESSPPDDTI